MKTSILVIAGMLICSTALADDTAAKARARVDKMDFSQACAELGRVVRTSDKARSELQTEMLSYISDKYSVGGDEWRAIAKKRIAIGMSECGAVAAWGRPQKVNSTTTAAGKTSQWVYPGSDYVYVDSGRVTGIQN